MKSREKARQAAPGCPGGVGRFFDGGKTPAKRNQLILAPMGKIRG